MSFVAPKTASLIEILQLFSPESSNNTLKKWVKAKRIQIDGHTCDVPHAIVKQGSKLTLGAKKEYFRANIEILYEDTSLVVIYKPAGLLSVATEKEFFYTAHDLLKTRHPTRRVYPVHRLDRDTSGIMLFAYTTTARDALKQQFEEHSIHREYHALVLGKLEEKQGRWESYLQEDAFFHVRECPQGPRTQLAITEFSVLKEFKQHSFVQFTLKTGRKNQIRVQAAHRGHPVLGDTKYGPSSTPISRLCLHAHALHFTHPASSKRLFFSYPTPKEFSLQRPFFKTPRRTKNHEKALPLQVG